jgi:hypothetical protein
MLGWTIKHVNITAAALYKKGILSGSLRSRRAKQVRIEVG